jgi:hypothetical protein
VAEGFLLDGFEELGLATGLYAGSHQVTHEGVDRNRLLIAGFER